MLGSGDALRITRETKGHNAKVGSRDLPQHSAHRASIISLSAHPTLPRGTCIMPIQFACPGCGKEFHVPEELAGTRLRCKGCSAVTTVPMEAEIVDDAPAADSAPKAEPREDE